MTATARGDRLRSWLSGDYLHAVAATFGTRIGLVAVGIGTSVVVARILGPEGRGLYAVASLIGALGAQFANLGLHASNTYVVAQDRSRLTALLANSLLASGLIGGAVGLALIVLFTAIPRIAPLHGVLLPMALVAIPISLALMLLQNLLLGVQDVRGYNLVDVGSRVIGLALITSLVAVGSVSVESVFAASALAGALCVVWAIARLRAASDVPLSPDFGLFRSHFRFGLTTYAGALLSYLVLRIDVLLVQYLRGPIEAGYYSLAVSLIDLIYILPVVMGAILFPRLLQAPKEHRPRIALRLALTVAVLIAAAGVIAGLVAPKAIDLLYGERFAPAFAPFVWLLPAVLFLSINTILMNLFASLGSPSVVILGPAAGLMLNVVANLVLVPGLGATGASIASVLAYGCMLGISLVFIGRLLSSLRDG
jgi:O-antigen/teichoic acid export membrane protein